MRPIVWKSNARRRLREIVDYISDHDVPAALELSAMLRHGTDRLAAFPQIGRPGRVDGTRELIVHPNYLIVYRVTGSAVVILDILHARRLYP